MLEDPFNEDKRSRDEMRPVIGAILIALLTIVVAAVASYAYADTYTAKTGADSITLMEEPCSLKSPWFKDWKSARYVWKGDTYDSCWVLQGHTVVVLDSAGAVSAVPMTAFRKDDAL
jgi:hypothetical protein